MNEYKVISWTAQKNAIKQLQECNQPKHENTLGRLIQKDVKSGNKKVKT